MATNNSSTGKKRPADVICVFNKQVMADAKAADSQVIAASHALECQEIVLGFKLCFLDKGEDTFHFYRDLDIYELYDIAKSAEIIQANVDRFAKNAADLRKQINESSKLLNDLCTKLKDANDSACAMRNCLKSILGFDNAPDELNKVMASSKELSANGQQAAEGLVKIAGIQTFSNVENLKPFAAKMTQYGKDIRALTDENIKKSQEDNKATQTEVTKTIEELNKYQFEGFDAGNIRSALYSTRGFICDGPCYPIEDLDKICEEVNNGQKSDEKHNAVHSGYKGPNAD